MCWSGGPEIGGSNPLAPTFIKGGQMTAFDIFKNDSFFFQGYFTIILSKAPRGEACLR